MRRKLFLVLAVVCCIAVFAGVFAGCNNGDGKGGGGITGVGDRLAADMTTDELLDTLCATKNYTMECRSYRTAAGEKAYDNYYMLFEVDGNDIHYLETGDPNYEYYSFLRDGRVIWNTVLWNNVESDCYAIDFDTQKEDWGWLYLDDYYMEDSGIATGRSFYLGFEAEVLSEPIGMSLMGIFSQLFRAVEEGIIVFDGEKIVSNDKCCEISFGENSMTFACSMQYAEFNQGSAYEYGEITVSRVNATQVDIPQEVREREAEEYPYDIYFPEETF